MLWVNSIYFFRAVKLCRTVQRQIYVFPIISTKKIPADKPPELKTQKSEK